MKFKGARRLPRLGTYVAVAAMALHGCGTDPSGLDLRWSKQGRAGGFADVDGDGLTDMVVGAPHAVYEGRMGVALVYPGEGGGFATEPAAILGGDRDFGSSFAELGDVDGDGLRDFAIGAIHGDGADVSLCGSVAVFAGGRGGALLAKLAGEVPASKFGYVVAGGDFNGDGAGDIAVGSPFHTPAPELYQSGAVYVYFGPGLETKVSLVATASHKGLGWAVAAGDVNGDGIDDLLLSTKVGQGGNVLAFHGGASFAPSLAAPDVSIGGAASGFGRTIAVLDDLDGDGLRDLAIGAPNAAIDGARDTGSVYLVRALAGTVSVDDGLSPSFVARIDGPGLLTRFGSSLAVVADVDGDGRLELAVGAPLADGRPNDLTGKVFFFHGKDLGPTVTLDAATFFTGTMANESFGTTLAPFGDGQLLVGAPRARSDVGAVYVVDVRTGSLGTSGYTGGEAGNVDCEHDEL